MPGVPGVMLGRNKHIAWGVTLANYDVEDLFIEKFTSNYTYEYKGEILNANVREEKIFIKGEAQPFIEPVVEVLTLYGNDFFFFSDIIIISCEY